MAQAISEAFEIARTGKQCRERWYNHIDPALNYSKWLPSEEDAIFLLARTHKNKWSEVAKLMPGRSENSIKNYFYSTVRKNIRRINRKLHFDEKIVRPIKELMKDPKFTNLIFCNSRKSQVAAKVFFKDLLKVKESESDLKNSEALGEFNLEQTLRGSQLDEQTRCEIFSQQFYSILFHYSCFILASSLA